MRAASTAVETHTESGNYGKFSRAPALIGSESQSQRSRATVTASQDERVDQSHIGRATNGADGLSSVDQSERERDNGAYEIGVGIASSELPAPERSLDTVQSLNLWLMMLFMGTQLSLPYTLSVYLVRDFYEGQGASEQLIGQLTGLLAAAQSFSRSITAYPWGLVSDVLGRKVCVLIGTVASSVSMLGFGFSGSYPAAIVARALPALFVGSPVALKSMIGESCDETGQAKAMVIFNLGHGLGTVLGISLGGSLAYPCRKFSGLPFCGDSGLLQKRPFLLPCLAVGFLGFLAFLANALMLNETHPRIVQSPGGWVGNLLRILLCRKSRHTEPESDEERGELLHLPEIPQRSDLEMGRLHRSGTADAGRILVGHPVEKEADGLKPLDPEEQFDSRHFERWDSARSSRRSSRDAAAGAAEEEAQEDSRLLGTDEKPVAPKTAPSDSYRWWRDRNVRLALIASGLIAFLFNFQDEMAPIFVSAPIKQGGLSMPLEEFTLPISFGGAALVIFSLALYPRLVKRFGAITMCRTGLLLGIPATVLLPLASLFTGVYVLEQAFIFASACFHSIAKVCALNSSMIAVNLVAPKAAMGAVNGGAMALQSGGRAFGPLLSGSVWAVVVSLGVGGQQFVGFAFPAIGYILTQLLYRGLNLPNR